MAEFDELRARFSRLDQEADAARRQARTAYLRAASAKGDEELAAKARAARERAEAAGRLRGEALRDFEEFTDPRRAVERLPDTHPLLLLPLRLETRFKTLPEVPGAGPRHELWVRIYPDDCSIDAFDAELSTAEIDAGLRFWREFWRAAGVDAEARAAWKGLAGAYGAGRAAWIVKTFAPVNPADRPTKLPASDVVLVVAGSALPPAAQRNALAVYWRAIWKAGDDTAAQNAARADLETALGNPNAAADAVARSVPFNLDDAPPPQRTRSTTNVIVTWLDLPAVAGEDRRGWRRAPIGAALPERFVLIAFSGSSTVEAIGAPIAEPIYVGPDPAGPEEDRILPEDGKLRIPDQLKWMFDFEVAVASGMGLRLPLTAEQAARGFDRVIVLGIRMRADADGGRATFEELIAGHGFSRAGFEILAQGSATNNAEEGTSAWSRRDDPDLAYDDVFGPPKFELKTDPLEKQDGQVFAERLGLDPASYVHARGADGRDAIEAQAINTALAPGTIGYMAGSLMSPVFEESLPELGRFFTTTVTGRGAIPAIRIGAQPYGVLASTAFSRLSWLNADRIDIMRRKSQRSVAEWRFLRGLHTTLGALEGSWRVLSEAVSHVGDGADPHKAFLDILGLHPNSAEFHTRLGKSLDELASRGRLAGYGRAPSARARAAAQRAQALALLRNLGYAGREPDILDLFFRSGQIRIKGPLIEAPPCSETTPLASSAEDGRNYLEWLADAARASLDVLRRQEGFVDDLPPKALLYVMLHFALSRGYQDAGNRLRIESGLFSTDAILALRREPTSVHVAAAAQTSDSPWQRLYEPDARITGNATLSMADHITRVLPTRPGFAVDLADQIRAIEILERTPTARLERAFVEHIDTVSYRFDAWRLGLVRWQLERMREPKGDAPPTRGLYLGTYGWLDEVRPKPRPVTAPDLPEELAEAFKEGPPLLLDQTNGGHLHAPSLNQAVTAAILRAGELANRTPGSPQAYSINLSSERVRKAVGLLDGVRTGQNLGALLGYRFERALHDVGGVLELDALIFAFRRAFPLVAERLTPSQTPPPPASESIEARNVMDGLALVKRATTAGTTTYPYGKTLPSLTAPEQTAVENAVRDLAAIFDAMADLVLAEGVHQAAQGNPDRVAAHLDIQGDFTAPPDPAVVHTPTRGFALTCRMGLELDPAVVAAPADPPRVKAQPSLNAWIAGALPSLATTSCRATWTVAGGLEQSQFVNLAELGLAPIDVINLISDEGGAGLAELDDRVRRRVFGTAAPRSDALFKLRYMEPAPGHLSLFVASALVKRLRGLALKSRPLVASDVALPDKAEESDAVAHVVARARVADVAADLSNRRDALDLTLAAGETLLGDLVASRAALLAGIDARIDEVVEHLAALAGFGGAKIGWGGLYDWRSERFTTLLKRISDLLARWDTRLEACNDALDDEAALPGTATPEERVQLLRAAEGQISTALAPDVDPVPLRAVVLGKRTAFIAKQTAIKTNALDAPNPGLADRLARCVAILPIDVFDPEPLTFVDVEESILVYWADLQNLLTTARLDMTKRLDAAEAALLAHDAALEPELRLKALQTGGEALFGEGFNLIPTFTLPVAAGAEQTLAHAHFTSGDLLSHARTALDDDQPLDTWFYGVARVRPKVRLLEDAIMLWEAHGLTPGSLAALQLPHKPGAPWLALDFPKTQAPDGERLAYVAFAGPGYAPAALRCGLLLDDWTETIPALEPDEPGPQQTTGVAFHFDRPSQEPPQAMLLLTPAQWDGTWSWGDILQGVIDTFDLARMRAVEPDKLNNTALAQYLPATVASVTTSGLSLSANFALVNMDVRVLRNIADA